jgi:undecaprenyl-diphosphatase
MGNIMQYDYHILMLINGLSGHVIWLDNIIGAFSKYGPLIFCLYLVVLWFTGKNKEEIKINRVNALYAFFSALLALGINMLIGFAWFRNRPYVDHPEVHQVIATTPDASFPSDHAAGSFSIAAGILVARPLAGKILTVLAVLLSLSRLYVGVHYPTDVLGGMLIGLISAKVVNGNRQIFDKAIAIILSLWDRIETGVIFDGNKKAEEGGKN